jgi:NADH dehydrogenase
MRVIVVGGTGFVGQALVRGLLIDGHQVVLMLRPAFRAKSATLEKAEIVRLDLEMPIVERNLRADAIINVVGIIREFLWRGVTFYGTHYLITRNLVDFARNSGITRFLQMSALGVREGATSGYYRTKLIAEEYLMRSGLLWSIFRPSVIFGPGDHLVNMLARMIRILPIVPVVGDGQYQLQPVHVDDVCLGFRKALNDARSVDKAFEYGGPEAMTYDKILDTIGQVIGVYPVRKFHQPVSIIRTLAATLGWLPFFPITRDQIGMLLEGNCTEDNSYFSQFDIRAKTFKEGITEYLR